jgi:hypothetical protein
MVILLRCVLSAALLGSILVSDVLAYTFRVGSDPGCSHNTIQGAIQTAFNNGPGEDNIYLANNLVYSNQRLTVVFQSINIVGGLETCSGPWTGGRTSIDGNGSHSIIEILGDDGTLHEVLLRDIEMSDGGADIDHGGAIQVAGLNRVILENVSVHDNVSARGAGIYFDGSAGALLRVMKGSYIGGFNNASVAGGGIYCVDAIYGLSAPLAIDDSTVAFNIAPQGGGVYLDNCFMQVFSRGTSNGLLFNEASAGGGGIFAINDSTALVDSGSLTGAEARVMIVGNKTTGGGGGGVYLDASLGVFKDSEISANQAINGSGGGIYAVNGSTVRLEVESNRRCPEPCSRLQNNKAAFGGGIKADNSGVIVKQTKVTGNEAGRASAIFVYKADVSVHGSIFAKNRGANAVTEFQSANTEIRYTTFADNSNQVADIFGSAGNLSVLSGIFHESTGTVLSTASGISTTLECLLVHDNSGLPTSGTIRIDDPMFVDRTGDNYHLSAASPAIDYCDNRAGDEFDINVRPRGIDSSDHSDYLGLYDLGADEFDDLVFSDSFETSP